MTVCDFDHVISVSGECVLIVVVEVGNMEANEVASTRRRDSTASVCIQGLFSPLKIPCPAGQMTLRSESSLALARYARLVLYTQYLFKFV